MRYAAIAAAMCSGRPRRTLSACGLRGGSAGSRREWGRMLGVAAILAFCAVAARPAVSENWVTLSTHGIAAIAVDADSVTTVDGLPGTVTAWFRFSYAVMLDCSPPRGCLASSQRIQYRSSAASARSRRFNAHCWTSRETSWRNPRSRSTPRPTPRRRAPSRAKW